MKTVGLAHPGQMGVSVGAAAKGAGNELIWASDNRSALTRQRADEAGFKDVTDLSALCNRATVLLSVCPPEQSQAMAEAVIACGYDNLYVDCNAVSAHQTSINETLMLEAGVDYVDGGIIGPPAWEAGTTRLYLSGKRADEVAELFQDSTLEARVIGKSCGAASALKMAYAGWTKGSAALLMSMFAMAKEQDVDGQLLEEWALSQSGLSDKLNSALVANAPKAWRYVGEMNEIATSLETSKLPREWFDAAAQTYQRLAAFKDQVKPNPDQVIDRLLDDQ